MLLSGSVGTQAHRRELPRRSTLSLRRCAPAPLLSCSRRRRVQRNGSRATLLCFGELCRTTLPGSVETRARPREPSRNHTFFLIMLLIKMKRMVTNLHYGHHSAQPRSVCAFEALRVLLRLLGSTYGHDWYTCSCSASCRGVRPVLCPARVIPSAYTRQR